MSYAAEIIQILLKAPVDGLPVSKISKHVFNAHNTFFESIAYEEVHADVLAFLQRQSKRPESPIERMEKRGYYRINPDPIISRQLCIDFDVPETVNTQDEIDTIQAPDLSLSLFPDM